MKTTILQRDFVTKDYEGFKQLMMNLIPTLTPEWTDTSESDLGVVILELLASGLDVLSYYQDKAYNESSIDTARTRKAVIKICRLLGYELLSQTPSVFKIVFTKSDDYLDSSITVTKGTKLSTSSKAGNPVIFELNEDVVISAGTSTSFGYTTQGETISEDIIGVAGGLVGEKFKLGYPDALKDTLVLRINENGTDRIWELVDNFLSSEATDRHFTATADEYNFLTIGFGSGDTGMLPPADSLITASYRKGGGKIGNVGLNTIVEFVDLEIAGVTFTNPEIPTTYGTDVEDIEHAKLLAPKSYRSIEKAVTAMDFEDLMSKQLGVSKVKAYETFNTSGDLILYTVLDDYATIPTEINTSLTAYANSIKLVNVVPIISDPTYVDFNIIAHIILYSNYLSSTVKTKVEDALKDVFSKKYIEFGESIYVASIYKEILSIEGIKNVIISAPTSDTTVGATQIARLGTVTITTEGGVEG